MENGRQFFEHDVHLARDKGGSVTKAVNEQVVVATGAAVGIGRACVRAFAARGARLGLISRNIDGLNAAAEEARQAGTEALMLPTDVSDPDAVEGAAAAIPE